MTFHPEVDTLGSVFDSPQPFASFCCLSIPLFSEGYLSKRLQGDNNPLSPFIDSLVEGSSLSLWSLGCGHSMNCAPEQARALPNSNRLLAVETNTKCNDEEKLYKTTVEPATVLGCLR